MNILDLKRMLRPHVGPCGYNSGGGEGGSDGGGEGASNGPPGPSGSPGSTGGGNSDGPMGPSAPSAAQRAAADGVSAQKSAEAVSRSYADSPGGWQSEPGVIGRLSRAHIAAGQDGAMGLNPANPTQTMAQIDASDKALGFLNTYAPAIPGLINPGFGMAISAVKALRAGNLAGYAASLGGGMLGAATGLPGAAGFGATLARNAVNGDSTSMGDAVGAIASGVLGMEGSKAAGVVGSVVGGEVGRQIGNSMNRK